MHSANLNSLTCLERKLEPRSGTGEGRERVAKEQGRNNPRVSILREYAQGFIVLKEHLLDISWIRVHARERAPAVAMPVGVVLGRHGKPAFGPGRTLGTRELPDSQEQQSCVQGASGAFLRVEGYNLAPRIGREMR